MWPAAAYREKRDAYWPEVEQFFGSLSPNLFRQGIQLRESFATFSSPTGQFQDIHNGAYEHPVLDLHFWLLDDWGYPETITRAHLERHIFLAMVYVSTAVYAQDAVRDERTNLDASALLLQRILIQEADRQFALLFPGSSPFWEYSRTFWQEEAEAALLGQTWATAPANVEPLPADRVETSPEPAGVAQVPPALWPLAGRWAFAKISVAAAAAGAGRTDVIPQLSGLLDWLHLTYQMLRDISTVWQDILARTPTYVLLRALRAAGLDPLQPHAPERALGAVVLAGTVPEICRECQRWLGTARAGARSLHLQRFTTYCDELHGWAQATHDRFAVTRTPAPGSARGQRHQSLRLAVPGVGTATVPKVIEMAEAFLLSDLTFKESWEVQRRGVFGERDMTAAAFPSGLIVEILCEHGHALGGAVDEIFSSLWASGFRYYNHPHLPPDADDLGLLLRLHAFSGQPARHREMLQTPLRWLVEHVRRSGEIPVWLTSADVGGNTAYASLALWGASCATVQANVLLGLLSYAPDGLHGLILNALKHWCAQITRAGIAATKHYVPLYALWTSLKLIRSLASSPYERGVRDALQSASRMLAEFLIREAGRPVLSPQDAAFLTLSCLSAVPQLPEMIRPTWIVLLGKTQRYDGSWSDEPLYNTPTRGELAAWYGSRSVTTAFCYHALRRHLHEVARVRAADGPALSATP